MTDNQSPAWSQQDVSERTRTGMHMILLATIAARGIYLMFWTDNLYAGLILLAVPLMFYVAKKISKTHNRTGLAITIFSIHYTAGAVSASLFLNHNPLLVLALVGAGTGALLILVWSIHVLVLAAPYAKETGEPVSSVFKDLIRDDYLYLLNRNY